MEIVNKQYVIDGIPVAELVKKYDSPLYVYETAKMESQYKQLIKAFSGTKIKWILDNVEGARGKKDISHNLKHAFQHGEILRIIP